MEHQEEKLQRRKKILLYYNAYSGSGVFRNNLDHIIDRCQRQGYQVVPVRAARGVVINRVFETLRQEEYSRILVAGGDGTMNMCVNAMVRHDIHLPIGLLPAGTANDFAYYFELPSDLELQLDVALGNKTTKADVGKVNNKCFINVCAMGALVDVSQKTDPNLKNALGSLAYYLKALTELPQVHPIGVKLTTPEKVYDEEIYFMVVMNGESAGGFRKLSPLSSMDDGKLDVIAFRKMPVMEFGPLLFEVVNGKHPENKNVLCFQTEELTIESEEHMDTDIDGEHGEELPLHFSMLRRRLDVFVSEERWHYDD
ncbi:MAG: YegS/Rv2252/BmrU family lipid kinase [Firmicutes bacterium]|nr:YegS/Rv2252/BmrU family lipid kinase [Bacillota bacterium]